MTYKGTRNSRNGRSFDRGLRSAAMALLVVSIAAVPAMGASIVETLSPSMYTVLAGEQFTISGTVFFPDTATYTYGAASGTLPPNQDEYLFGLIPTSPHLMIAAGTVEFSADFPMGSGGPIPAYFEDIFGQGGWLGPTTVSGPDTTAAADWRTFIVPVGTPPGVYDYSYGVIFSENGGVASGIDFASNLEVNVVPEPAPLMLVGLGLVILVMRRRKSLPRASSS
jgi:hypothetical protein